MKISSIKAGILGTMVSLASVSCSVGSGANKDLEKILPYLTGKELVHVQSVANKLSRVYDYSCVESRVQYWDSISTKLNVEKAYNDGVKMVKDSLAGKPYTKQEFKLPLDTVERDAYKIISQLKEEVSSMTSATQFYKINRAIQRAPYSETNTFVLHYYNNIYKAAKSQEAYNKGVSDALAEHNSLSYGIKAF